MLSYFLVAGIFLAAGFTQGVAGFGSALVAMPLLLFFLDAKTAVPLCMLNGLLITGYLSLQLKTHMDWRKILPLAIGCLPGILVGIFFLKRADDAVIRLLLGIMLLAYVAYSVFSRSRARRMHWAWSYVAGFGTGAIGSAFSAGGPPTIIYTTLTGWKKDTIKATLSGFFFLTGICIAIAHALTGLTTILVLRHVAASAFTVLVGVWVGSRVYDNFSKENYIRAIWMLLTTMGIMMIASALW